MKLHRHRLLLPLSVIVISALAPAGRAGTTPSLLAQPGTGGGATTSFGHDSSPSSTTVHMDDGITGCGGTSIGNDPEQAIVGYGPDGTPEPASGGGAVAGNVGINDGLHAVAPSTDDWKTADWKTAVGGCGRPTAAVQPAVARWWFARKPKVRKTALSGMPDGGMPDDNPPLTARVGLAHADVPAIRRLPSEVPGTPMFRATASISVI